MNGNVTRIAIDGTSALKPRNGLAGEMPKGRIIAFPSKGERTQWHAGNGSHLAKNGVIATFTRLAKDLLSKSEMYCSLKFESFSGCPYNLFSDRSARLFALAGLAIAAVSLAFGV